MTMLGCIDVLLAFLSIFLLCFWWWNRSCPLINWPVFGMWPGLLRSVSKLHDFVTYALQQSGGTFVLKGPWFCGFDFVITSDPMNVNHILNKNFANYHKGPEFKQTFEHFGDGIFNSDSDWWRTQRKINHSFIKHKKFELAVKRIMEQKISKGLFLFLEHAFRLGSEVDLQETFQRFMLDNICLLVLGFDPNCLSNEFPQVPYMKAFADMEDAMSYRHIVPGTVWKLQKWLQIGPEKKFRKAWETFDSFAYQRISSKREQLSKNRTQLESEEFNLLTYFLIEDDGQGGQKSVPSRSNKFLRDTIFTLLVTGKDTVSAGLVWLLWLVGTHPSVERKILEEIKANLQGGMHKKWRLFSSEELSKLTYLHAAICETPRLYPPGPINYKVSIGPDILPSGHHVDRNTRILYSPYAMGRMEEIWGADCLEFKPERWISNQGKIKHVPSYKSIAFDAGPRTCLGKDLAFMQMKSVASAVIWNYRFQVVKKHPINPTTSMVLHIKHGLKVRVSRRFI